MIKSLDHLNKVDLLSTQQVGRVVDNNDPRHLLRVRVYVKGIYEESDVSKLPWAFPKGDSGLGGKPDSSNFQVPEIGSEVLVTWVGKDVYHPFYTGGRSNSLTVPQEPFIEDYPNSVGTITPNEWFKNNKTQQYLEYFAHELGKYVKWDGEGNLIINIPKSLQIQIGSELQIGVGGSTTLSSGNNNVLTAGNICYVSATNGFGTAGGGMNASFTGAVHIKSPQVISLDGSQVHLNSGMGQDPSTPSEVSALLRTMASIDEELQALKQQAQAIAARVAAVQDKIGK